MCGRFSLTTPSGELAEAFDLEPAPDHQPRYNVAPSQVVLGVIKLTSKPNRRTVFFQWGHRLEGGRASALLINARAETAAVRLAFRTSLRTRRCLIPADGFYEWTGEVKRRRQPVYIHRKDNRPFALAGLWWPGEEPETNGTCVILTTAPNELLRSIHDRMPVILASDDCDHWLDPTISDPAPLAGLMRPSPADPLIAYPVGPAVNDARYDAPDCIRPLLV